MKKVTIVMTILVLVLGFAADGDFITIESLGIQALLVDNTPEPIPWQHPGLASPFRIKWLPQKSSVLAGKGMNLEYTLNGAVAYDGIIEWWRHSPAHLEAQSPSSAILRWWKEDSPWNIDGEMVLAIGYDYLDITFRFTPYEEHFSYGYASSMFASYVTMIRSRCIYFYGQDVSGQEGWICFGDESGLPSGMPEWFFGGHVECGTISHPNLNLLLTEWENNPNGIEDMPAMPHEEGVNLTNLADNVAGKKFIDPFYYGIIDADDDLETKEDNLIYLVLFEPKDTESVRFAMWDWWDHDPMAAWDWQWVTVDPQVGQTYEYKSRTIFIPFTADLSGVSEISSLSDEEIGGIIAEQCRGVVLDTFQRWLEAKTPSLEIQGETGTIFMAGESLSLTVNGEVQYPEDWTYQWLKDGQEVAKKDYLDWALYIESLDLADSGFYSCQITNTWTGDNYQAGPVEVNVAEMNELPASSSSYLLILIFLSLLAIGTCRICHQ